jgi:hypothetical protein
MPIFGGSSPEVHRVAADDQMLIRRGDVPATHLDGFTVTRMLRGQWSGATEKLRQNAISVGRNVEHYEDRRRQVRWERTRKRHQRFDAAR